MNEKQRDTVRFAEVVLGVQVVEGPPPPGSKLARLVDLEAQCRAEGVSEAEFHRRATWLFEP